MTTPDDSNGDWEPVARRGEFSLTVITTARCAFDKIPMHPEAQFLGVMIFDDKPPFALGFLSVDRLREYISEMAPRVVAYRGVSEADALAFQSLVEDAPVDGVLH
jgi:hypothetical protein